MGTSLTPAQRKQSEVRTQLRTMLDKAAEKYVEVLPKHISPSRMVQIAINAATNQPKLFDCTPGSFALAVMAASQCGIEPDGYHGHLIPYGKTCQFVPDYKGLIQLALRNGVVIDAQVVYENDHFEYTLGTDPKIVHIPNIDGDRGDKRCAYAVAKFKDGTVKFIVATKQEIEKRRAASSSSSKSDSPWKKWEDEMWQKSAVKMLMKYVPRSQTTDHMPDPITMALRADDAHERGVTVDPLALASGGASRARPLTSRADHIFEAIDHNESPSEQFAKAIEMVDTEEGVKSLYSTMIDANREQIDQQELEEAVEARELRLAVIRGEVE